MKDCDLLSIATPEGLRADLLVIGCCENEEPPLAGLPEGLRPAAGSLAARPGWKGSEKQYLETDTGDPDVPALALQGLGKTGELTARRLHSLLGTIAERAQINGAERLALALPGHPETRGEAAAERVTRSACLAAYRFDRYLTDSRLERPRLSHLVVVPPPGEVEAYRRAAAAAGTLAEAVAYCRDLANTPGNVAGPDWMEEQARELARSRGLELTVLHRRELEERGMGGLLAVGSGSRQEPRLLHLEWGGGGPTVGLVGKGITFDTGGISIKPAMDMDEMKYDKCGACAVLAIVRAAADLELPLRLIAAVPVAENMPDGSSYRPGDIVRCYNGKTVEILNTDAEGRMILADALAWVAEKQPEALLEFSTLTGAAVVALGQNAGGLYTPDDGLARELLRAAEDSGERLWRMPLWPEFLDQMKGHHADLKNSGSRWGSANTAAAFLSQFVGDVSRWAHLDIAGGAYVGHHRDEPQGATGYGVALALNWFRNDLHGGGNGRG